MVAPTDVQTVAQTAIDTVKKYGDTISDVTGNISKTIEVHKDFFDFASKKWQEFTGSTDKVAGSLKNVGASFDGTGVSLQKMGNLVAEHSNLFGVLALKVINVGKEFEQLDGMLSKSTGFRTYTEQYQSFIQSISNIPMLEDFAKKMGMADDQVAKFASDKSKSGIEYFKKALGDFIEKSGAAADQEKRLQELMLMRAGETGYIADLAKATDGFKNLNEASHAQFQLLKNLETEFGLSKKQALEYYTTLSAIPEVFGKIVNLGEKVPEKSLASMLLTLSEGAKIPLDKITAAYESARNAGNAMAGDTENAATHMSQYLAGLAATSNNLHLEFTKLSDTMTGLAGTFKYFGDEGIGVISILNQYVPALKNTGLSAQNAADLVGSMITNITSLTEAQKAYISQQTGGPGGLQGAFEIDQLLREGKIDQVMMKIKDTLTAQMGPLVSLQEARESPEAASQYERQLLMLRQGPLGGVAKTQAEAERIMDALKSAQEGSLDKLENVAQDLQDFNTRGESESQRNATYMSHMQSAIDSIEASVSSMALDTAQSLANIINPMGRETFLGRSSPREGKEFIASQKEASVRSRDLVDNISKRISTPIEEAYRSAFSTTAHALGDVGKEIGGRVREMISNQFELGREGKIRTAQTEYSKHHDKTKLRQVAEQLVLEDQFKKLKEMQTESPDYIEFDVRKEFNKYISSPQHRRDVDRQLQDLLRAREVPGTALPGRATSTLGAPAAGGSEVAVNLRIHSDNTCPSCGVGASRTQQHVFNAPTHQPLSSAPSTDRA